jgi:histone deacetylase complex regulatory component SIN3
MFHQKLLSVDDSGIWMLIYVLFSHRMTTQEVVEKVQNLLSGQPRPLITGFNMFLPEEFHIRPEKFNVAMNLVKKIRARFEKSQPKVLSTFVEILARYQDDAIPLIEARSRVKELFKGQADLLEEFDNFLPMESYSEETQTPSSSPSKSHAHARQSEPSKHASSSRGDPPQQEKIKSPPKISPEKGTMSANRSTSVSSTCLPSQPGKRKSPSVPASSNRDDGKYSKIPKYNEEAAKKRVTLSLRLSSSHDLKVCLC